MPRRSDDWYRRTAKDPRYCVICKEYYSPEDWAIHPHNPDQSRPSPISRFINALIKLVTRK